jgi:hypothetical protein
MIQFYIIALHYNKLIIMAKIKIKKESTQFGGYAQDNHGGIRADNNGGALQLWWL